MNVYTVYLDRECIMYIDFRLCGKSNGGARALLLLCVSYLNVLSSHTHACTHTPTSAHTRTMDFVYRILYIPKLHSRYVQMCMGERAIVCVRARVYSHVWVSKLCSSSRYESIHIDTHYTTHDNKYMCMYMRIYFIIVRTWPWNVYIWCCCFYLISNDMSAMKALVLLLLLGVFES